MKFPFRTHISVFAPPIPKHSVGWRTGALHAFSVCEAAEQFLHEQLQRKRDKTLRRDQQNTNATGKTLTERFDQDFKKNRRRQTTPAVFPRNRIPNPFSCDDQSEVGA